MSARISFTMGHYLRQIAERSARPDADGWAPINSMPFPSRRALEKRELIEVKVTHPRSPWVVDYMARLTDAGRAAIGGAAS